MTPTKVSNWPQSPPNRDRLAAHPEFASLTALTIQASITLEALRARTLDNKLDAVQIDQATTLAQRIDALNIAIEAYTRATLNG